MAALRSRCGHYIFALWFLSSIFFIPRLISAVGDWMFTIPEETKKNRKLRLFHINGACFLPKKHTKQIKVSPGYS